MSHNMELGNRYSCQELLRRAQQRRNRPQATGWMGRLRAFLGREA